MNANIGFDRHHAAMHGPGLRCQRCLWHAVDANSSFLKMLQLHVYKVGSFSRLLSLCSDSNNVSVANSAAYK